MMRMVVLATIPAVTAVAVYLPDQIGNIMGETTISIVVGLAMAYVFARIMDRVRKHIHNQAILGFKNLRASRVRSVDFSNLAELGELSGVPAHNLSGELLMNPASHGGPGASAYTKYDLDNQVLQSD